MNISLEDLSVLGRGLRQLHFDVVVSHPERRRLLAGTESTEADVDLEVAFGRLVHRYLGSDVLIIGEEAISANKIPGGHGPWVVLVDPIDGTRLYHANDPGYACTFAIVYERRLLGGCVYLPDQDDCYLMMRSCGVYRNGRRISARRQDGLPLVAVRSNDIIDSSGIGQAYEAAGMRVERLGSTARRLMETALGSIAGVVKTVGVTNGTARLWGVAAGFLACEAMGLGFWLDEARRLVAVGELMIVTALLEQTDLDLRKKSLDALWNDLWSSAGTR
jgi:fructose-1,6-bisphosphatase/inositol monophosphatase family enzyme